MLPAAQALPAIPTRTGSAVSGRRRTDMVTRIADLVRARKRLAAGVGVTTIEQRVLPFVPIDVQIPARVNRRSRKAAIGN